MLYTHEKLEGKICLDDEQSLRCLLVGEKTTAKGPEFTIIGPVPEVYCGVFDPIKKQFVGIFDPSEMQVLRLDESFEIIHDRGYKLCCLVEFHGKLKDYIKKLTQLPPDSTLVS